MPRVVPPEQVHEFGMRVMAYVGVDPSTVVAGQSFNWSATGGDKDGFVEFKVAVPTEDLIAMFNGEDRPSPRADRLAAVREVLAEMKEHGDEVTRLYYGSKLATALGDA